MQANLLNHLRKSQKVYMPALQHCLISHSIIMMGDTFYIHMKFGSIHGKLEIWTYLVMHHLEDEGEFHFGYPMAYTEP